MSEPFSRRQALKGFALLVGAASALRATPESRAAEAVHLSPTDPAAVALGYHESVKTVNPKDFPTLQPLGEGWGQEPPAPCPRSPATEKTPEVFRPQGFFV